MTLPRVRRMPVTLTHARPRSCKSSLLDMTLPRVRRVPGQGGTHGGRFLGDTGAGSCARTRVMGR